MRGSILGTENPGVVLAIVALNLALTLFTALVTLRDFPNSGDEYSYLLSAQLFAAGRLSVPSPEPREFFEFWHVINDGRYYGKYPPGWPLILSLGVLVNAPWLVNPVLGMLTLILIHRIARENFSGEVASATLYVAAANPFLIFNSASYFSHPSCLLFMTLFAYAAFRCLREATARLPYLVMGASLGVAFVIRPYTALALALPFGAWLLVSSVLTNQLRVLLKGCLLSAVPLVISLTGFLVYNDLQTGHWLLQPFSKYNPRDTPFNFRWGWRRFVYVNVYTPLIELNRWIPLSLPLLGAVGVSRKTWREHRTVLLLTSVVGLVVAYWFFQVDPGNRYGPRYLYEASFAILILIGCVVVRWRRLAMATLVLIAGLNVYLFVSDTSSYAAEVRGRMTIYDLVEKQRITNAIVFLKTGSGTMPRKDLTRNGIHFDGPVLYVHDLGERNGELLRAFPGRHAYIYEYDGKTGRGRLSSYGP
jgi:4-amino-4-deoxy-L-arabinose transferase-like glycosyltransferase